jgi:hypothetical protein
MTTCSHCGQSIKYPHGLNLTHQEMTLFIVLFEAYPRDVQIKKCEQILYAHRRDGGPLSARSITCMVKYRLDNKLRTKGWMIEGERGLTTYRLMKVYPAAKQARIIRIKNLQKR